MSKAKKMKKFERIHKWVMRREGIAILTTIFLAVIAIFVSVVLSNQTNINIEGDEVVNNYNYGPDLKPIDPKAPSNFYTLAMDCYESDNIKGAITYMQKALQAQIDSNQYEEELNYDTCVLYYNLGLLFYEAEERLQAPYYEEAAACFKQATAIDDVEIKTNAYFNMGYALSSIGMDNFIEAETYINKALELNPKLVKAYLIRGYMYSFGGDPEKAISDLTKVLNFDSENGSAYYWRAYAYRSLGEVEKAKVDEANAEKYGAIQTKGDSIFEIR